MSHPGSPKQHYKINNNHDAGAIVGDDNDDDENSEIGESGRIMAKMVPMI